MILFVTAKTFFGTACYKVSTEDYNVFHCLLHSFEGKTPLDRAPEQLELFRKNGKWLCDLKMYRELSQALGNAIEHLDFDSGIF